MYLHFAYLAPGGSQIDWNIFDTEQCSSCFCSILLFKIFLSHRRWIIAPLDTKILNYITYYTNNCLKRSRLLRWVFPLQWHIHVHVALLGPFFKWLTPFAWYQTKGIVVFCISCSIIVLKFLTIFQLSVQANQGVEPVTL